jgi:hypothetical protein
MSYSTNIFPYIAKHIDRMLEYSIWQEPGNLSRHHSQQREHPVWLARFYTRSGPRKRRDRLAVTRCGRKAAPRLRRL